MLEYIRLDNAKEGMILGRTIYNEKGQVLLAEGNKISKKMIPLIHEQNYKGLYIENDADSRIEDIPIPEPIIPDSMRIQAVQILKETYNNQYKFEEPHEVNFTRQRKQLEDFVSLLSKVVKNLDAEGKLLLEFEETTSSKDYVFNHMINTSLVAMGIATKLGLDSNFIFECGVAGLYATMGKSAIDQSIIFKSNATESELKVIREYPEKMFRLLQKLNYPVTISYGVWMSKERADGSGFPTGVKLNKIPLSAQIVSIADKFDDLVSASPYNEQVLNSEQALEYLQGCGYFNTDCLRALLKFVVPYSIGSKVKLSNGEEAIVLKNRAGVPLRPYIIVNGGLVDMTTEYLDVTILEIIK